MFRHQECSSFSLIFQKIQYNSLLSLSLEISVSLSRAVVRLCLSLAAPGADFAPGQAVTRNQDTFVGQ